MDNLIQIVSVPVITGIVYGAMELYKQAVNGKESLVRLIPIIAVVLGTLLGIVAFYAVPDIIPAENVFVALLIGAASGAAATGTNQAFKQLFNSMGENQQENSDEKDENN